MPKRSKAKGRRESGSFLAMPHSLCRHETFATLSPRATKLFMDLAGTYNGANNGDFSTTRKVMRKRGWKSRDQVLKAQTELLEKGFMILTRQGGKNKCNLYALTIWPIDECKGKLDVAETRVASNDWKSFSVARHEGQLGPPLGPVRTRTGNVVPLLARHEGQS